MSGIYKEFKNPNTKKTTQLKQGQELNRKFSKEEVQIVEKSFFGNIPAIGDIQIKLLL